MQQWQAGDEETLDDASTWKEDGGSECLRWNEGILLFPGVIKNQSFTNNWK